MKKIKDSFGGVIAGILLLIAGTYLLWWNEGNNVRNIATTNEVEKTGIEVKADSVDENNEGKLVAVAGNLEVMDEALTDTKFNISVKSSKLVRKVEMYQWEETEHTDDDDRKTYTYEKKWSDDLINSQDFHQAGHNNPGSFPVENQTFQAKDVKVGAFNLTSKQIEKTPASANLSAEGLELSEEYNYQNNYVTTSKNLDEPEVGDIRISWQYNDWEEVTVLAVQKGNTFVDFVSKDGKSVNRVEKGLLSLKQIVQEMRNEDKFMKWILRLVGALLVIFGYLAILNPLSTLASFVPLLGGLVGGLLSLLAFLVGLVHSLIIIVIAWFRFRPLLSVALIAVIVVLVYAIITLLKSKKKNQEQVTA